jgi:tripartite-type tricarboxylate transporter receptor subunit TctC
MVYLSVKRQYSKRLLEETMPYGVSWIARLTLALLAGLAMGLPAGAQSWPTGPVKFVVPFAAGGTTDLLARTFGRKMSAAWGQPVIIENRTGAGGIIGSEAVARSAPDGQTILLGTIGTHGVSTSLVKNLPFNPEHDFEPITLLATLPNILTVHDSIPAKDLAGLIEYARANPGKLNYASAGSGTASHIAGEYFKRLAGIDAVHVPYKGSMPALTDLIAGHVAFTFDYLPSALPHVRSGMLRALAVTGPLRSRAAPELPTAVEAGLDQFVVVTWFALYAPARTPRTVVDRIRDTIAKAAKEPDVVKTLDDLGVELVASTPEELARFQRAEIERWSRVIKEANIAPQ